MCSTIGKKGKLSPRFIGPYMITERVGEVAYMLEFPPELSKVHNVFHVSMLRHYVSDPSNGWLVGFSISNGSIYF
ncbi:hypothetical protein C1H46_000240 [Malus baccata]|uniref:Tf2-1-like SH3-like domain-containing protein n=1 Tax=Malus baccata TaxID=106549 RepID=A0A540NTH4_MALBA|nr:hypothetical protein C1H46_000240 [Malus baccata]